LDEGYQKISDKAKESGLTLKDYFDLKVLFFIVDAASYPNLRFGLNGRPKVFEEDSKGKLTPTSPNLIVLFEKFNN
jgi:hypothetical protein